jgi:DNA-directed RNA polymerase subunit RPC12/RpoP
MKWTDAENAYIAAHANEGAEAVRWGLLENFGHLRSYSAVERHGLRLGISWTRWEVCPICGTKVRKLNKLTGYCDKCHWRLLADKREQLKKDIQAVNAKEEKRRYKREAEAVRYEREKFVKLSGNMSEALVG